MSAVTTSRLQCELSSLLTWKPVTSYTKHGNLSDPYSRVWQRLTFVWKVLKRHNAKPTVNVFGAWIFFSAAQINCWAVHWASLKAAVTRTRGNEMHTMDSGAISPSPNTTIGLLSHSCQVSLSVKCKCDAYLPYNPFRVVIILLTLLVQDTNHVASQYSATKVILSDSKGPKESEEREWDNNFESWGLRGIASPSSAFLHRGHQQFLFLLLYYSSTLQWYLQCQLEFLIPPPN